MEKLPWFIYLGDEKLPVKPMLKDMLLSMSAEVNLIHFNNFFIEVIRLQEYIALLPSIIADGVIHSHTLSKTEFTKALFDNIDKSKFDPIHYQLLSLCK